MKVVLDTNVIISAFLWVGKTSRILDLIKDKKIEVFTCQRQIVELQEVLSRKKFDLIYEKTNLTPEIIVAGFLELAHKIEPITGIRVIGDDPSDDIILFCALTAGAEYIITGDKHLLSLKKYAGNKIVKPSIFLNLFD